MWMGWLAEGSLVCNRPGLALPTLHSWNKQTDSNGPFQMDKTTFDVEDTVLVHTSGPVTLLVCFFFGRD